MKRNSTLLLILLLLKGLSTYSQNIDISWGPEIPIEKHMSQEIAGTSKGLIFILKTPKYTNAGSYYIDIYQEVDLKKKNTILLESVLSKEMQKSTLERVLILSDKIVILTISKNNEFFGTLINFEGTVIKSDVSLASNFKSVLSQSYTFGTANVNLQLYQTAVSKDLNKFVIGYALNRGKGQNLAYTFSLFDTELNKLASYDATLPYDRKHFTFLSMRLDNSGDAYITGSVKIEGAKQKFDTHKLVLLHLTLGQKEIQANEANLPIEKNFITSMTFFIKDDRLNITGLYADSKYTDNMEGVFYIEMDKKSLETISSVHNSFPKIHPDKKISPENRIKNVFVNENKEKFLVMEENFYTEHYNQTTRSATKKVTSHDIIVIKLDKDNKIQWTSIVFKYQYFILDNEMQFQTSNKKWEELMSYLCVWKDDKLFFVFNDHLKNIKSKENITEFTNGGKLRKESYTALVSMNLQNGEWEKKELFNVKAENMLLTPQNYLQFSDSEVLTFSFGLDMKTQLGKLRID